MENCSDVLYEYYILGKNKPKSPKKNRQIGTIIKAELEKISQAIYNRLGKTKVHKI